MKQFSTTNTYLTSTGERLNRAQIETRIKKAKAEKIDQFTLENDYCFCEECGVNASNARIDCSHDVSVKECLETGFAEKAFDVENIKLLCRNCHNEHDRTYISNCYPLNFYVTLSLFFFFRIVSSH